MPEARHYKTKGMPLPSECSCFLSIYRFKTTIYKFSGHTEGKNVLLLFMGTGKTHSCLIILVRENRAQLRNLTCSPLRAACKTCLA